MTDNLPAVFDDPHFEIITDKDDAGGLVILGCAFVDRPSETDWLQFVGKVKRLRQGFPFVMGDLLAGAEAMWGETYSQAMDATDYDYDTLASEKYVCERIPFMRRRKKVTHFAYYREIAPLPVEEQEKMLDLIEAGELVNRDQIRAYKKQRRLGFVQDARDVAMERDALANENHDLQAEVAAANGRLAAIEAQAAARLADDPQAGAEEAYRRDAHEEWVTDDYYIPFDCIKCGAVTQTRGPDIEKLNGAIIRCPECGKKQRIRLEDVK